MNQTWENDKKPGFEPDFDKFFLWFLPLLEPNQTWESGKKTPSFWPNFGPFGPNSGHQIFLNKIWLCQSLDIMVSYHHVQYQKKLMIQSWKNLVTDNPIYRQMDKSDFVGCCLTNVECPVVYIIY